MGFLPGPLGVPVPKTLEENCPRFLVLAARTVGPTGKLIGLYWLGITIQQARSETIKKWQVESLFCARLFR